MVIYITITAPAMILMGQATVKMLRGTNTRRQL
jgi:hypothetical protein